MKTCLKTLRHWKLNIRVSLYNKVVNKINKPKNSKKKKE